MSAREPAPDAGKAGKPAAWQGCEEKPANRRRDRDARKSQRTGGGIGTRGKVSEPAARQGCRSSMCQEKSNEG
ncbi:hypothetical protein B6K86_06385 [Lachnospiraceae bacterium]|nr:hypothetical protein B6K86_06385 [Lachnospiraceae bacterium]